MAKMKNGKAVLNMNELEMYVYYCMTNSELIDVNKLKKLQLFMTTMVNIDDYEEDFDSQALIHFINKYLQARLDERLNNDVLILDFIGGNGNYHDKTMEIYNNASMDLDENPLSVDDIINIENRINNYLKYKLVYEDTDPLKDLLSDFSTENYSDFDEIITKISSLVGRLNRNFSKVNSTLKDSMNDFDSNGATFFESLKRQYNKITNPSTYIKSSVKMMNEMLNGGFESERLYVFAGIPGGWKSGQLLNIAMDAKHYNKIEAKDPTKEPAVLYITQENSINETIERIWSYYFSENDSMKNYTYEEVQKKIIEKGFNQGTRIFFKYRTSKSISASDIESYIDNYASEGYEICLVIHDYTKRLRPNGVVSKAGENENMFAELGAITDELNAISKDYHIPVVSAAQLNRSAYDMLSNMNKNPDKLKYMNNSVIGESTRLVENVDYLILINKSFNSITAEEMMVYNATKKRGNDKNGVCYFGHPFENKMKLKPDIDTDECYSVNQLSTDLDNDMGEGSKKVTTRRRLRTATTTVEDNSVGEPIVEKDIPVVDMVDNKEMTLNDIINEEG